jgi:hypothetical protein
VPTEVRVFSSHPGQTLVSVWHIQQPFPRLGPQLAISQLPMYCSYSLKPWRRMNQHSHSIPTALSVKAHHQHTLYFNVQLIMPSH